MQRAKTFNPTAEAKIGARVRAARLAAGLSQEALAAQLGGGLTFQQLQKYEKGTNRVSVTRLIEIANITGQPLSFFIEDDSFGREIEGLDATDLRLARRLHEAPASVRSKVISLVDALLEAA